MLHLFKKKIFFEQPMEILGIPLSDSMKTGKEKYVIVEDRRSAMSYHAPASYGFNPSAIDRSRAFDIVLEESYGKVLDVGACTGKMSLKLQNAGFEVYANDISASCIKYMKENGVKNLIHQDVTEMRQARFDTILCLGSTLGLCGSPNNLGRLIIYLCSLLGLGGQLIIEDATYGRENGFTQWTARFSYKNYRSAEFIWSNYELDYVRAVSAHLGMSSEVLLREPGYSNYLVRINV